MTWEIGFMQGRLSPQIDGKIQAFPWKYWQQELVLAAEHKFLLMEWTIDHERLRENPLVTPAGQKEISDLIRSTGVQISSLTGDCFMQAPFYKAEARNRLERLNDFELVCDACAKVGIRYIVFPLVDHGKPENQKQKDDLLSVLDRQRQNLVQKNLMLLFETEWTAEEVRSFFKLLDPKCFGWNYDIGNSASLGFDPDLEFKLLAGQIKNVHVKDRILGGATVPLGTGNADFPKVFGLLKQYNYNGKLILQAARARDNDHLGTLLKYREKIQKWILG